MRGGGLGPYEPGEYSDDTQMAVCIARVAATGADLRAPQALDAVAANFLDWYAGGASDVGNQTASVLGEVQRHGTNGRDGLAARMTAAARTYGALHPRSAGNGALMRTAIVGLTALDDRHATADAARAVAALTHADPLAGDSCVLWSEAVRVAVLEQRLELAGGLDLIPAERRTTWAGWIDAATGADPRQFTPNGFTVTALQAAWAAITDPAADGTRGYEHLTSALETAVRIGNDTDTVAAIAGGLLGAYWGASSIPLPWRRVVHGIGGVDAEALIELAVRTAALPA